MLKHILVNWKTSSLGIGGAVAAVVNLVFSVRSGTANQNTWTITIMAVIGALVALFAGDADKAVAKTDVQADISTGFLKKADVPPTQPTFTSPSEPQPPAPGTPKTP